MPNEPWDDAPRFRPSPAATLVLPAALAFLIQVPASIAAAVWHGAGPLAAAASVTLAAASALALLGARRWPGPTVAVIAALTLVQLFVPPAGLPPFAALAFAIIAAVVRGARVWAIAAVGTAWIVAMVTAGLQDAAWPPFRVAITTLGLAVCFAIGVGIRARVTGVAERRAQLAERRRTTEQEERTRIARELHDVLAHSLSQISVQSGMGLHLFDREPEKAREALQSIRALSATGLDEVRGVLSFLRGDDPHPAAPLTPQPQLADLQALVAARSGLGLTVHLDDALDGDAPPSAVQTAAYRIAQEAVTNVVRHSAASVASVHLERSDDALVVTVTDDGGGMTGAEGSGLRGMRERAVLAGGSLDIAPHAHQGTVVTARLPWSGPR